MVYMLAIVLAVVVVFVGLAAVIPIVGRHSGSEARCPVVNSCREPRLSIDEISLFSRKGQTKNGRVVAGGVRSKEEG